MAPVATRANPLDKHEARRRALADSALLTLGELGYAKASLREIANNSEFSHGVVHYYFAGKLELIVYCVQQYKATCVTRYDATIAESTSAEQLLRTFADQLCTTIVDEAPMHRLWYDLRSQSMFEADLRDAVEQIDRTLEEMIWRVVRRYAELAGAELAITSHVAYGAIDGLFQQGLLGYLAGREHASLETLRAEACALVPLLLRPVDASTPQL